MSTQQSPRLVLASASPYRASLLSRLGLSFVVQAADVDESPRRGESPMDLVARLALAKASALAPRYRESLIIGSDQVGVLDGQILTKPGGCDRATAQLSAASGREVAFHTGLCLYNAAQKTNQVEVVTVTVRFRTLSGLEIAAYLDQERPYDCAGSFRVEGPGVALFAHIGGGDPDALQGLPLITLCRMLRSVGYNTLLEVAEQ